jgi:predicted 3-demethylubiquinone-9 3-methyltransferase (glyoxalase superfamily)
MTPITTCLWFDTEAEDAAAFYTSLFANSSIGRIQHYGEAGPREPGTVMTVEFTLDGQPYIGLNGGPDFRFTEAISLMVRCRDQDEVDRFWSAFADGGEQGPCGWIKDRFGLSWQVVPTRLFELVYDNPDRTAAQRAMKAMLGMKKIVVADLEAAAAG